MIMTSRALIGILFLLSLHVQNVYANDDRSEDEMVYQTTLQDSQLIENNRLPLVEGELWDPALNTQISVPNLNPIAAPEKPIDRSFFYLAKYLYENIKDINENQKCLCPLSSLIALNNIKNIYKGEKYIDEFLTGIHFDLKLDNQLIEKLICSKMGSIRIEQSLSMLDKQMESKAFLRALMGLDDEMIASIKWLIEQFLLSLDNDLHEVISDFSLIHWDESDIISQISDEEWLTIQALKIPDLREHLKGNKNQFILEFSLKLLNRNDAKFLMFLKFFSSFKKHLKSTEDIKKIIKVSWFIMKNKQLICSFSEEEIMNLFDLDKEKAQILGHDFTYNIPLYLGNIRSSLADACSNPKITYSRNPLNTQDIHFRLCIPNTLSPTRVKFEDYYTDGMSGIVKGFYQETAERRTIALPAIDDLFLIIEDSNNNLPEYITFSEHGEQKEFFLSLPLFEKKFSGYSLSVPWKKGSTIKVKNKITLSLCGAGPAKNGSDNTQFQEVRLEKPFRYAVARQIQNEDGTISYAILLTGINDASTLNKSSDAH